MYKLLLAILLAGLLQADVILSDELKKGDIGAEQYQLFVTNTAGKSIDGLDANIVYFGDMKGWIEQHDKSFLDSFEYGARFKIAEFLTGRFLSPFDNNEYVSVVDYNNNGEIVTRVIKYIIASDDLEDKEIKEIFKTTDSDNYYYNNGNIVYINGRVDAKNPDKD